MILCFVFAHRCNTLPDSLRSRKRNRSRSRSRRSRSRRRSWRRSRRRSRCASLHFFLFLDNRTCVHAFRPNRACRDETRAWDIYRLTTTRSRARNSVQHDSSAKHTCEKERTWLRRWIARRRGGFRHCFLFFLYSLGLRFNIPRDCLKKHALVHALHWAYQSARLIHFQRVLHTPHINIYTINR